MTSSADDLIPSFPSEVIDTLPLYYRALVKHLVNTGRVIIEETPEKRKSA